MPLFPHHMLVAGITQEAFPFYHARISRTRQGPTVVSSAAGENFHCGNHRMAYTESQSSSAMRLWDRFVGRKEVWAER
jgi:hypothetical protein